MPHKTLKEVKITPRIAGHDLETKKKQITKFLAAGHRVKLTVFLRGREKGRPETAVEMLEALMESFTEVARIEQPAKFNGQTVMGSLRPR